MSAPANAYVIGEVKGWFRLNIPVECPCGWSGMVDDLLGEDETDTLWCPMCGTTGWVYK